MAQTNKFDAIIGLGAVIRGSTPLWFCCWWISQRFRCDWFGLHIPVINAILTTDSIEQAIERSGTKAGNKGSEAAMVALEMINVLGQIDAQADEE